MNNNKLKLTFSLYILINSFTSFGQQGKYSIVLGGAVPDLQFTNVIENNSSEMSIVDYKGKVVILDFWATWCNSCIKIFPKLDSLQVEFSESVQFVLVNCRRGTLDTKEKILEFLKGLQNKGKRIPSIPIVTDDSLAKIYFPHTYLPHYVWISPEGKLLAVTTSTLVTRESIQAILKRFAKKD